MDDPDEATCVCVIKCVKPPLLDRDPMLLMCFIAKDLNRYNSLMDGRNLFTYS